MHEITIISGKGGTGKTSLTASFAQLEREKALVADCDVDAANMHLLADAQPERTTDFYSGYLAQINREFCTGCGKCIEACRFDAITEAFEVDKLSCEGCGYCYYVCPPGAVILNEAHRGKLIVSATKFNNILVHARLDIAGENSGKLVSEVKNVARDIAEREKCGYILIDGSPGIGCPVIASLTRSSFALIVAEPSKSGYHDMVRLHRLIAKLNVPSGVLINKSGLSPVANDRVIGFARETGMPVLGEIPYHNSFHKALMQGRTILEIKENGIQEKVTASWNKLKELL